jgi:PAS domain S-box-containing protein
MPTDLIHFSQAKLSGTRIVLYTLLAAFNAFIWLLLAAFRWQISLRAREIAYFDRYLFPIHQQIVPLPVIYVVCVLLTLASILIVFIDRHNVVRREKLRALFGQIIESLDIGILVLDRSGRLILVNESGRKLLPGISSATPDADFRELLKDHPKVLEMASSALQSGNYAKEVEYSLDSTDSPFVVRLTTVPLRDLHKHIIGTLLLVHDVHEVMAMERQMRRAERLSALGTLAATLAHEIRNPLEAINLNLELLGRHLEKTEMRPSDQDMKNKYLRVLEAEISRLVEVTNNFLSFVRPGRPETKTVSVTEVLRQVVDLIQNQASAGKVELEITNHAGRDTVEGSEDQLKQVFLNIILNGLEAMPDGGKLSLLIQRSPRSAASPGDGMIAVRIEDTGEGIPPDKLERLFDPFFSGRPHGTGLGLTIAQKIIEAHRGRIEVESEVGRGTRVTVELPSASSGSEESLPL